MSGNSEIEKRAFVFTWRIENVLWNVFDIDDVLISPVFTVRINKSNAKWVLRLGISRFRDSIPVFLRRVDEENIQEICVGFDISCITVDGTPELVFKLDSQKFTKHLSKGWNTQRWRGMMKKKHLYFPNNSFTVRCQMWSSSPFVVHSAEYLAVTHLEVTSISYQKDIYDFYSLGIPIKCYPLSFDNIEITLYQKEESEYLSVEFRLNSSIVSKIRLQCKLSVRDSKGILMHEMEDEYHFRPNNNIWKFPDLFKVKELAVKDRYCENPVNLQFNLRLHSGNFCSRIKEVTNKQPLAIIADEFCAFEPLCRELEALYSEKRYTDVEIRSGKEAFTAHKSILRARSPVFAAMFDHDMVEKETSVVQIEDVEATTLDALLSFMYSGVVKNMDEDIATKLLSAADKYQVLTLKKKCATFLKNIISPKNACLLLLLGDIYREELLQKTAQEYICYHHREIFPSDEWRMFVRQHGELASEVIQTLSVRYTNV